MVSTTYRCVEFAKEFVLRSPFAARRVPHEDGVDILKYSGPNQGTLVRRSGDNFALIPMFMPDVTWDWPRR